jgi:hypothetical protein
LTSDTFLHALSNVLQAAICGHFLIYALFEDNEGRRVFEALYKQTVFVFFAFTVTTWFVLYRALYY